MLTHSNKLPHSAERACDGFRHYPCFLGSAAQRELLEEIRDVIARAPLYRPAMPRSGAPFSVAMTNCGSLGWVSDKAHGYRYERVHPVTGEPWPAMPRAVLDFWRVLVANPAPPQACLINYYRKGARLDLHRDTDEKDFSAPVLSVSLGDTARFRVGGLKRKDPARTIELTSGDVVILGGQARLAFHGVDRIYAGTSGLLAEGGRFNLTLRRVTKP